MDVVAEGDAREKDEEALRKIREEREEWASFMRSCGWTLGFRENMSLASVVTPCLEEKKQYSLMSSMHKRNLKKAQKDGLVFSCATKEQRAAFYDVWLDVAELKKM